MAKRGTQPIGQRVLDNYNFLRKLSRARSEDKKTTLLTNASCDELLALIEISSNVLAGRFCLTRRQRAKITPFANYLRRLARLRSEKGARKFLKNQKGGQAVFGALLAPILIEAASHLISKVAGQNG